MLRDRLEVLWIGGGPEERLRLVGQPQQVIGLGGLAPARVPPSPHDALPGLKIPTDLGVQRALEGRGVLEDGRREGPLRILP